MGNLLGAPVTEKETHSGVTDDGVQYGVSSMQGWRVHMEDAHIAEGRLYAAEPVAADDGGSTEKRSSGEANRDGDKPKVEGVGASSSKAYNKIDLPGHSLFAVFDGHGGTFAAEYSGRNLCRVLSRQPKFVQYAKFAQERVEKEKAIADSKERSKYIQVGMDLLEQSLCDAFVELDREIACALKATKVPDADRPYNSDDGAVATSPVQQQQSQATGGASETGNQPNSRTASPADSPLQLLEEEGDSGTTCCMVLITPDWIVCANAGDSRAVLSRAGNKAVPLSYDHKPDDDEEERRIRAAGGYVAGGRVEGDLAVSRGLGDFRFKFLEVVMAGVSSSQNGSNHGEPGQRRPDIKPGDQKVSPIPDIIVQNRGPQDEFIVLACDGIWDVQTNYEAVRTLAEMFNEGESNLGLIAEEVCDVCLGMGSKDNMTVLAIKFEGQKVGTGGGVLARRQLRDSEHEDERAEVS